MPARIITADGRSWSVYPSGLVTQSDHDEFGLLFMTGAGSEQEIRVTRYSPQGTRSREQALAEMPDEKLLELFNYSQPSFTSPETDYRR